MATIKYKTGTGWATAETPTALKYTEQNLSELEQQQARQNLGIQLNESGETVIAIDQHYNRESANAQSGVAVSQLEDKIISENILQNILLEEKGFFRGGTFLTYLDMHRSEFIPVKKGDTFFYCLYSSYDGTDKPNPTPVIAWFSSNEVNVNESTGIVTSAYFVRDNSVLQSGKDMISGTYITPEDGFIIVNCEKTVNIEYTYFYKKSLQARLDLLDTTINNLQNAINYPDRIYDYNYVFRNSSEGFYTKYGDVLDKFITNAETLHSQFIPVYTGDIISYSLYCYINENYKMNLLTIYNSEKQAYDFVRDFGNRVNMYVTGKYVVKQDGYIIFCTAINFPGEITIEHSSQYNYFLPPVKWCALGDSITEGYYSDPNLNPMYKLEPRTCWAKYVADLNNYELTNHGVGGSGYLISSTRQIDNKTVNALTLTQDIAGIEIIDNVTTILDGFKNFDLVTLAYGINDWKYNEEIGTSLDSSDLGTTMCSNMKKTIETILASNPYCKIIVITPLRTLNYATNPETTNTKGYTLQQVCDAQKEICKYYGIEYIDMTNSSIINNINAETLLPDGVHPSLICHKLLARELSKKINY